MQKFGQFKKKHYLCTLFRAFAHSLLCVVAWFKAQLTINLLTIN